MALLLLTPIALTSLYYIVKFTPHAATPLREINTRALELAPGPGSGLSQIDELKRDSIIEDDLKRVVVETRIRISDDPIAQYMSRPTEGYFLIDGSIYNNSSKNIGWYTGFFYVVTVDVNQTDKKLRISFSRRNESGIKEDLTLTYPFNNLLINQWINIKTELNPTKASLYVNGEMVASENSSKFYQAFQDARSSYKFNEVSNRLVNDSHRSNGYKFDIDKFSVKFGANKLVTFFTFDDCAPTSKSPYLRRTLSTLNFINGGYYLYVDEQGNTTCGGLPDFTIDEIRLINFKPGYGDDKGVELDIFYRNLGNKLKPSNYGGTDDGFYNGRKLNRYADLLARRIDKKGKSYPIYRYMGNNALGHIAPIDNEAIYNSNFPLKIRLTNLVNDSQAPPIENGDKIQVCINKPEWSEVLTYSREANYDNNCKTIILNLVPSPSNGQITVTPAPSIFLPTPTQVVTGPIILTSESRTGGNTFIKVCEATGIKFKTIVSENVISTSGGNIPTTTVTLTNTVTGQKFTSTAANLIRTVGGSGNYIYTATVYFPTSNFPQTASFSAKAEIKVRKGFAAPQSIGFSNPLDVAIDAVSSCPIQP